MVGLFVPDLPGQYQPVIGDMFDQNCVVLARLSNIVFSTPGSFGF